MNHKVIRILLIEDNPGDADLLRETLAEIASLHVELTHVEYLSEGLQRLAETCFDLILLDLSLPDSEGLGPISRINQQAPQAAVVVLTGLDNEGLAVEAMQAGAQDYLVKGQMESTLLKRTIRYAIERQRMRIELNQQTNALLHSEMRFHNMIEHNADGIIIIDQDGLIRFVNPAGERLFGQGVDRVLGELFSFPVIEGEKSEFEICRNSGQRVVVEMRVVETSWDGQPAYLASLRDITLRVQMEEALRESEEKFRTLFENAPIGLGLADADGKLLTYNKTMLEAGGYAPDDLTKLGSMTLLYCDPAEPERILELVRKQGRLHRYETRFKRKDGSCYEALLSLIPTTIDGTACLQAMVEDITEHKQLEEQYRQSQKMEAIGQLSGGIAHDFNNLLTAINGFAELLQMRLSANDPNRELVDKILGPGQRAADLVGQLLAFSRKQIIEPEVLDLNSVVMDMDKMLRRIIDENIQIQTYLGSDLWSVKIDPTQIEQIILNLAVNARDAMPEGGRLTIETANVILGEEYAGSHLEVQPGEHVLLAVSDTGVGMTRETQAHIFEPFFTTKEKGQGTGLGLATVYGIVKQNGGNIWVYSEENQGTSFKIYLPRANEEETHPKTRSDSEGALPSGNETILLVEDDAGVREFARDILQMQGYTLIEAEHAQEALHLSIHYTGAIDLVVTDVVMPGMNGKALAERLNQTHPEIKILFMSGYTDNAIAHHDVLDENVAFLQKPFSPMALSRKVREILDDLSPQYSSPILP